MNTSLAEFEKVNTNLWKREGKYYRLHSNGTTPNGCWRINPIMVGLTDIDATTGKDVPSGETIQLDYGTVSSSHDARWAA